MSPTVSLRAVQLVAVGISVGLAAVHLTSPRLRPGVAVPRERWLSFAGGASVAYVFVHILPEVDRAAAHVREVGIGLSFLERHVYLTALIGFVAYYGVERMAKLSAGDREATGVFWTHIGAFGAYNFLVGYLLLHREEPGLESLLLFGAAMGLHFYVNDRGIARQYGEAYRRRGRWLLASAVLAGTATGFLVAVPRAVVFVLFAFLAGGIILNVIKEEVPEECESRFSAFALGAAVYTVLVLLA